MVQQGLFNQPPKRRPATLDERFRLWVFANEKVVELFLKFAREARQSGAKHFGIGAIAERVRWEVFIYRLARLLVERDPSLGSLFEFRKLRS